MISQPFYVGYNNSRFRGISSDGYLLPLETEEELQPDNPDKKHQEPEWLKKQWQTVQQLHGMILYLQKQVVELAAKKRKEDYLYE